MYQIFHHTPYGYLNRDGWIRSTTQFSAVCGASTIKNKSTLFNGHDSHVGDHALRFMVDQNTQPFFLKPDDLICLSYTGKVQGWLGQTRGDIE